MPKTFQIALCQMKVTEDKEENLKKARKMILEAGKHAHLVVLPEMFNCPYETIKFPKFAEERDSSPTLECVSKAAKRSGAYLVAGSIPEKEENRVYNTSFIYNPEGKQIGRHRKMHLFDINVPGDISFHESETLTAGNEVTVLDTSLCRIGVCICYDLRFPELTRLMALDGAMLMVVPGAFNTTTGPAHWKTLIRARSIDNQVYMAAASPARDNDASYVAYGHSMVVDPWGDVLSEAGEDEEIIYAGIDLERVSRVREELPLLQNRRDDLYKLMY